MTISESDWKKFKALRAVALERFCARVLDECRDICTNESTTAHERYGEVYGLIRKRDKQLANAFDDLRRSTATLCLGLMVMHDLLTEEGLSGLSPDILRAIRD